MQYVGTAQNVLHVCRASHTLFQKKQGKITVQLMLNFCKRKDCDLYFLQDFPFNVDIVNIGMIRENLRINCLYFYPVERPCTLCGPLNTLQKAPMHLVVVGSNSLGWATEPMVVLGPYCDAWVLGHNT